MATGFDAHAWGVGEVVGQGGVSLEKAWSNGTRAYRSIGLPGFPNFFMLVGPNSPIGNISLIDVSETQARYIFRCIKLLQEGRARSIAPNADATRAFHETLLAAMENTVWVTGCNSWYLDADGVPITWPWTSKRFHRDLRRPRFGDFDLQTA
jgi:cation diffusion facilitator CzcD-associated flavoprotein CzcO